MSGLTGKKTILWKKACNIVFCSYIPFKDFHYSETDKFFLQWKFFERISSHSLTLKV